MNGRNGSADTARGTVGLILILGIRICLVFLAAGWILEHFGHLGSHSSGTRIYRSLGPALTDSLQLNPNAIMTLGLLVLVLTPIARVAGTAVHFFRTRDPIYTILTLIVLALLLLSILLGHVA